MITFKTIEYKNFLSTGNVANKIALNSHKTTLLVGLNGNGKSTIIDALTFSLYGKPFRNISKGQLINSITAKNTLTTVEFDTGGSSYKVIRGIKPNIFEIWKDGDLLNQDAAVKDYQAVLEQQILKINHRTFTQVVILGAATFVPFMQLPSSARREIIEDILDIRIFSVMNTLLKEKIQDTKKKLEQTNIDIQLSKSKIDNHQKLINSMVTSKDEHVSSIQDRIVKNLKEIQDADARITNINTQIDGLNLTIADGNTIEETISHANAMIKTINHSNIMLAKSMSFLDSNENCPSCSQNIPHEHKSSLRDSLKIEYDFNLTEITALALELERCRLRSIEVRKVQNDILSLKNETFTYASIIGTLNKQNESLALEISSMEADQGNIDIERNILKGFASAAIENVNVKTDLQEQRNIEDISSILLKDTGIKTAVIKEYLPAMNTLINKYLTAMDFYVSFELDESFSECIKSRYRDNFTYSSFSEGEKKRLDLAILFAWREIARLKNSANTNLLILDEVLEGSLDSTGTDFIMNLLSTLGDDVNIFVISHNTDQIQDKFERILTVEKKHDFSEIN